MAQIRYLKAGTAMQFVQSLYPRFLVFSGVLIGFLILLALIPMPSDATAVSDPVRTSAGETSTKLGPDDCRLDQHARAPTCQMQGRTIRVINF